MRSATKTFVGLAGIGVMIAAARAGLPVAAAANTASPTDSATSTATPTATETPTPTPTATSTATKTPTPKTTKKTTSSGSSSSGSSGSSGSGGSSGTTTATSQTSSTISYRFGAVQVKVTKKSGKITAVDLLQATATNGRNAAFPSLVQATIDNNGTGFGNLSGATYTTDAFKKAVNSALAKF